MVDGRAEIRHSREKAYVEVDKSGFPLLCIWIMLDIIIVHKPADSLQVSLAEHLLIEFPNHFFVFFYAHMNCLSAPDETYSTIDPFKKHIHEKFGKQHLFSFRHQPLPPIIDLPVTKQ
jgi:hypothetical protein